MCRQMAQTVGWRLGRPCNAHAPIPVERMHKAMRTVRGGKHLVTSRNKDSEKDATKGKRARFSDPWLAPIDPLVEHDFVWDGYIDPKTKDQ